MSRNRDAKGPYDMYGPYSSYAESRSFEVARGEMCASRRRTEGTDAAVAVAAAAAAAVEPALRGTQQYT